MKSITWCLLGIYLLVVLYGIYKYGFYDYIDVKKKRDRRQNNINKLVNYIN